MWGVAKDNSLWFRVGSAGRTGEWAGDNWTKVFTMISTLMRILMKTMMRVFMRVLMMRNLAMLEILMRISTIMTG